MSMVFRFRMLSDENDNFVRDYEVLYDTTLLDFHNFILRSLEYEDCMASFFTLRPTTAGRNSTNLPLWIWTTAARTLRWLWKR